MGTAASEQFTTGARITAMLPSLLVCSLSLLPGMPNVDRSAVRASRQMGLASRDVGAALVPVTVAATAIPLPAVADDGFDLVGTIVNFGLSAVLLGFIAYIAKFALEAAGTLGEAASDNIKANLAETR